MVIAHGGDSVWNGLVLETIRSVDTRGPVEVSFLMGPSAATHRFQDAAARLEAWGVERIVVVPLLVSSHSGHYEQIRYLAGLTDSLSQVMRMHLRHGGIERPTVQVPLVVTPALDDAPELARALADRARSRASAPREQALLLLGHGPNSAEDYAFWMAKLRPVADSVRAWTGFADVRVELLREDAPAPVRAEAVHRAREIIELQHRLTGREVVVSPILISRGGISRSRIMTDLAGLRVVYAGEPVLPHPAIARWIERRVAAASRRGVAPPTRNRAPGS
jgi:sirohydrochlorin ferrochelatase